MSLLHLSQVPECWCNPVWQLHNPELLLSDTNSKRLLLRMCLFMNGRKLLIRYITWSTVINTIPPISEQMQLSAKPPSEPLCSCDITVPRLIQRNSETLFCLDKWGGKRQHLLLLQHYKKQKQITLSLQTGNKKHLNLTKQITKSFPLDQRSTLCAQKLRWPGFSLIDFFSSLRARVYFSMTMPVFILFHTWFGPHRAQTLTPVRILGICFRRRP